MFGLHTPVVEHTQRFQQPRARSTEPVLSLSHLLLAVTYSGGTTMCLFFTAIFAFCCGCFLGERDKKGSAGAGSKSVKSKRFPFVQ